MLVTAVIGGTLLLVACSSAAPPGSRASNTPVSTERLVTFGHSYVVGVGASSAQRSWPQIAAAQACRVLVNYAHSGDRVAETKAIVDRQASTLRATDVVAIQIGINDVRSNGTDPAAVADYQSQLGSILRTLKGHRVLLVEADRLPITSSMNNWGIGGPAALALYNEAMERAAANAEDAARDITLVGPPPQWNPAADIASDQLHPNDAGHALIARSVDEALKGAGVGCS
ncbi:lysophospholipase L1-like esterase [Jatrophihabitans sp. GAS493]|nr:lysophospholipase L1-like esterase [Jatrophihabitans sp. GAS493]